MDGIPKFLRGELFLRFLLLLRKVLSIAATLEESVVVEYFKFLGVRAFVGACAALALDKFGDDDDKPSATRGSTSGPLVELSGPIGRSAILGSLTGPSEPAFDDDCPVVVLDDFLEDDDSPSATRGSLSGPSLELGGLNSLSAELGSLSGLSVELSRLTGPSATLGSLSGLSVELSDLDSDTLDCSKQTKSLCYMQVNIAIIRMQISISLVGPDWNHKEVRHDYETRCNRRLCMHIYW